MGHSPFSPYPYLLSRVLCIPQQATINCQLSIVMSEFNEILKDPKDPETQKADAIFAPVMSPSWSKTSLKSKPSNGQQQPPKSFKDKIKRIFE